MNQINTNLSVDAASFIRKVLESILISFDAAYPEDTIDIDCAHTSLHSIEAKVGTLIVFLDNLKPDSTQQ